MTDKPTKFEQASFKIDWALALAYKKAVKLRGITDWGAFTPSERKRENTIVEEYQIKIADWLLQEVK